MLNSTFNLSSLDGTNGFVINGINSKDYSGSSVSSVGDINNDGIDDIIIGAYGANNYRGKSYVVFGSNNTFDRSLDLSSLDGTNGFVIKSIDKYDYSGLSVSGAGDINNDGIDDIIIGAYSANNYRGKSYVVFGSNNTFDRSLNLGFLDGTNGFVINGIDSNDKFGRSVSSAGDINNDGIDDIIIGAYGANNYRGKSYVVFGSDSTFDSSLDLSSLDGTNGFVIKSMDKYDYFGRSVSGAGDINNDGIDDIIVGASNVYSYGGKSYVVFGSNRAFNRNLNLGFLDGTNGFAISEIDSYDYSGSSVSGVGDINDDGIDDIIIGADSGDPNGKYSAGESYVVFGSNRTFDSSLELSSLDGTNGLVINGINSYDYSGWSVSDAGDINNDGIDDIIIGADGGDPNGKYNAGESYVVFGSDGGFSSSLELSSLDGTNGLVINGIDSEDFSGYSVSSAGDINNDGIDDIIIGASGGDSNGNYRAGESYVVFGSEVVSYNLVGTEDADTMIGGVGNDSLGGKGGDDYLAGNSGNDTLKGENDNDSLNGGNGDDLSIGGNGNDSLNGGNGTDTLVGGDNSDYLYGGKSNDYLLGGVGLDTLRGSDGHDTLLGSDDKDILFGDDNGDRFSQGEDYLSGGKGDDLLKGWKGDDSLFGGQGNDLLRGEADNDSLTAGEGNDLLFGGHGNDYLNGKEDNDILKGGGGDDTLEGGAGRDILFGNAGQDTFVLLTDMETADRDAIRDFELDTDLLGVSDLAEIDDLNIVNDGRNSSSIILGNNGQQIALLFGKPNLTLDDLDFVEI